MQARYYDYMIGRFYSTDPIGYQDQLNLYAYVANDPVNATDPTGMSQEDDAAGCGYSGCAAEMRNFYSCGNPFGCNGAYEQLLPRGAASGNSPNKNEGFWITVSGGTAHNAGEFVEGWAEEILEGLEAGAIGGPGVGAGFKVGAGVFAIGRTAVNANKLNHIFGQARHNLGPLVQKFGSQQSAFTAVESAIQSKVAKEGLTGVFKTSVSVGGQNVEVRGKVIDGVAQIGTFYISK